MSVIEEVWWTVTTKTGLALTLPAPLQPTAPHTPRDPGDVIHGYVQSTSQITGKTYLVDMREALFVTTYVNREDPERYQRSVAKALGLLSSDGSSSSGQAADSPSDETTSPGGPFTGARIKRTTLH